MNTYIQGILWRMKCEYYILSQNLSQNSNINELFNEFSALCVQMQSAKGVVAQHFEMITDPVQIRNNQINGMLIGIKSAAYRDRIIQFGDSNEIDIRRRLLDIYLIICTDDDKLDIRNTIRNAIVQNKRYNEFNQETKQELNILFQRYVRESNRVIRANPLHYLV